MARDLPFFQRIGIYGVGLLGGSVGLAIKRRWPQAQVVGIGRSVERLNEAVQCGAVDEISTQPDAIEPKLDALILCTPVRLIPENFKQTLASLTPNAVVTDVGSTKDELVAQCEAVAGNRVRFVGSHPMAGSHETGVAAARAELLDGRVCIVTPNETSDAEAVKLTLEFWQELGMRVTEMSPADHDRLTAHSSHLPHLTAKALCRVAEAQGDAILPVVGTGFHDTTRLAAGSPDIWFDICLDNQSAICDALTALSDELISLKKLIESGDEAGLREFLEKAKAWKDKHGPRNDSKE
ncbi:MAG: prephenate dehydrogenase/arogenate dehydrogenase family protein [Candidatus Hinthialibacter antarcticus]|nr:prephenate dehydrogenase/arogenate dehydrogenase family protein [Candidatus Hinthialibacter antarcticus]